MRSVLAVLVVAAAAAPPVAAQAPAGALRLTVEQAVDRGVAASHRLAEAAARGAAADAVASERRADQRPQVAALAGYTRTNHVDEFGIVSPSGRSVVIYPDVPDNYRTRLDLQWPIYTSGRADALERAARAEAGASADELAAARADLRLEITRAYWALATAIESVRVVDESVRRMDAHLRDVRNQLAQGLIPPNEVLTVEAQESHQRMLAIQARATRDSAAAELARLVGAPPDAAVVPISTLEPAAAPQPPTDVAALVGEARANRRDRAALIKRIGAADERQTAAAAADKPMVAVAGGVDYARPNARIFPREAAWRSSWDASVNVSWNLFDGGRAKAAVAEAAASARAAGERLADFDANLGVDVRQRLNDVTAAAAAVGAATDAVRSAAEARRVVGERFAAGVATSTDVLDAQVALLQAELDRTQALANERLAQARFDRAVGR